MSEQSKLGEEKIGKLLAKYSVPAIIGMLVNTLYSIIDRMYIGHIPNVGSLAITGVGVTMPITCVIIGFGLLIGVGTAASISIRLGQGKREDAEKLLGNAFILIFIVSILITTIGNLFIDKILLVFGASSATLIYARNFMRILLFGTIFNLYGFGLNHSVRADGNPKIAMFTMLIGGILNIILDPIFIFVLKLGIEGAAIATVISQLVSAIWILFYFTKGKSNLKLKIHNLKLNKHIVMSIISIGMAPFFIQIAASAVQITANNSLRAYGGDVAIGAMTVIMSINSIFLMPIFGLNQGSQPIIGFNYGAKKYDRVKETMKYTILTATIIVTVGFILIQLFPSYAIKAFNKDSDLVKIATNGIRIYLAMLPIIGFQIVSSNYFQAVGKAKFSVFLGLLRQVIFLIPLFIILPKFLGLKGVWLAGPISDSLAALISFIVIKREMNRLERQNKEEIKNIV